MTLPAMPPVPEFHDPGWPDTEYALAGYWQDQAEALRSVALAYLEALHVATDTLEKFYFDYNGDRTIASDVVDRIGKLPGRAV